MRGASAQISETAYHSFKSQDQAIILLVSRLLALRAHWAQWSGVEISQNGLNILNQKMNRPSLLLSIYPLTLALTKQKEPKRLLGCSKIQFFNCFVWIL